MTAGRYQPRRRYGFIVADNITDANLGSLDYANVLQVSIEGTEISSSNFLVSASGDVVMQGTITATAGGQIGGFTIASSSISNTDFFLSGRGVVGVW